MTEADHSTPDWQVWLWRAMWAAAVVPALAQACLLLYAVLARVAYPYDLEWMEGGMLAHASRISERQGIYVEPSVDFIPFLYTPLYPAVIALFGGIVGIGYPLGRVLSVLSMLVVMGLLVTSVWRQNDVDKKLRMVGAAVALGFFAATYPWVEGWYDIVRGDSMFLAMMMGGLAGVLAWARMAGKDGRRRLGAAAAILALSFFCKQTGVLYVAAGGAAVAVLAWRRLPMYIGITGAIGLGGTWLLNRASDGWFWTYVFDVHQAHDWNKDRFYASFGHILGHFPAMTAVIALGLVAIAASAIVHRRKPPGSTALLYWSGIFALSCVVGAIGWGTQWAHFNAFIPAMATGALAAGAAIPALWGAVSSFAQAPSWMARTAAMAAGLAMSVQLATSMWNPKAFIPTSADRDAGDKLIERIRQIDGDVFMPYHPWYPVLAGKPLFVHRMGILDMTYRNKWKVAGLDPALADYRFSAVIMDDRPVGPELSGVRRAYRMDDYLSGEESPKTYTGAKVVPRSVWVPAKALPIPEDARVLWDFEDGRLDGWKTKGRAWGKHPASGPVAKQGAVRRYGGRYFVTSFHGGDKSTGALISDEFLLEGSRITFRLSGGNNDASLRAELWVDNKLERTVTAQDSEGMEEIMWNIAHLQGQVARIVLVDEATGPWGHLNADEFWIWD